MSEKLVASMVARTPSIGSTMMTCFNRSSCGRCNTISSIDSPTIMRSVRGGGDTTIPPCGNVTGWILSAACLSKSMPTAAAAAVLAIFSNVLAMWSRPFLCHLVRGLPFSVRHPFFSFRGSLIVPYIVRPLARITRRKRSRVLTFIFWSDADRFKVCRSCRFFARRRFTS